jgi:hypothetical protein
VLERGNWFNLVLVNAFRVKALPGKNTDQMDSEKIAELSADCICGMDEPTPSYF